MPAVNCHLASLSWRNPNPDWFECKCVTSTEWLKQWQVTASITPTDGLTTGLPLIHPTRIPATALSKGMSAQCSRVDEKSVSYLSNTGWWRRVRALQLVWVVVGIVVWGSLPACHTSTLPVGGASESETRLPSTHVGLPRSHAHNSHQPGFTQQVASSSMQSIHETYVAELSGHD
jgi:hypothetical protein